MFNFYFHYNLIQIFLYFSVINVFHAFTMEELKGIHYDIDISVTPVKKEETSLPVVYVMSKNGQEFQCILPQFNDEETSEKEVINEKDTDVLELLKPLKTGPCLSKTKDWWTYEFCLGHYIKQFHVEDGEIIGQVLTLGLYDSDYDWNNETDQEKFKHSKQKYHSQYYTNGTKCDLTGQPRVAEIRIYCEEDAGDYIYRVDEPATCSYVITVHTSRLCSHPLLKPLPSSKAHAITCNPVLSEKQYAKYLEKLKEEKAQAEERRSRWLADQHERLQFMKNQLFADDKTDDVPKEEKDASKEENDVPKKEENKPSKPVKENYETVRDILVEEYNREIEKLQLILPPERFASVKDGFQKRFGEILEEVKEDFDLNEDAENIDIDEFKIGLKTLSEKLEKAVKGVIKAQEKLHKAKSSITDVTSDAEELLDDTQKKKDTNEKENTPSTDSLKDTSSDPTQAVDLDDDKLQVRIRRLDRKSPDASGKLHEMDVEQRKKLEEVVKERLQKAGLDTGGRRIEVKIITAGYYDNEDKKDFQFFTDDETDQFQNMIMALLTGQQEAIQEMKRHKKMEESYTFSWDDDMDHNEETDNKED